MKPIENDLSSIARLHTPLLEPGSAEFLQRVMAGGLERYRARLRQYGFDKCTHVLDAGCGFGQWALALAPSVKRITAMDPQADRLFVLRDLCKAMELANIDLRWGQLEKIPADDATYDAIFCYGAIFLSPWRDALREFWRVLKPGGRLYVNADGLGYFLHVWHERPNRSAKFDPKRWAAAAFLNTVQYDQTGVRPDPAAPVIIESQDLQSAMSAIGFVDIVQGPEGTVRARDSSGEAGQVFYQAAYHGHTGVYECLAFKP